MGDTKRTTIVTAPLGTTCRRAAISGTAMAWLPTGVLGTSIFPHPLRPDGRQVLRPG